MGKTLTDTNKEALKDLEGIERFPINSSDYFNSETGNWQTEIIVLRQAGIFNPNIKRGIYTLEEVRNTFLGSSTEYEAAMKLVTDWDHWNAITASGRHKKYFSSLREEKELKDRADAKRLLWEAANKGNVSAQKIIYESDNKEIELVRKRLSKEREDLERQQIEKDAAEKIRESLSIVDNGKRKKA